MEYPMHWYEELKCQHCKMDIRIRNPSGFCDHLYYPSYCNICKRGDKI